MKNNKDFSYHLDPVEIAIGATALTLISSIFSILEIYAQVISLVKEN